MAKAKNPRRITVAGEHIGRALSPKELLAVATAVRAATTSANASDRKTLKLAFAKLRAAEKWKALNAKTRSM